MTVKYVDGTSGSDSNAGTLVSPWLTLGKFLNNTGSWGLAAGDTCWVRRGRNPLPTAITANTGVATPNAPITVKSDDGTQWTADQTTLGQTATLTQGSVTVTGSGSWTGVATNDCVKFGTDPQVYEVATVSGTTLTLFLPYRGASSSGTTTYRLPQATQCTASSSSPVLYQYKPYYIYKDMYFYGVNTITGYVVDIIMPSKGSIILDGCLFFGASITGGNGIVFDGAGIGKAILKNSRFILNGASASAIFSSITIDLDIKNCLIDCNSKGSTTGLFLDSYAYKVYIDNTIFKNSLTADINATTTYINSGFKMLTMRNTQLQSTNKLINDTGSDVFINQEDFNGVLGDNRNYGSLSGAQYTCYKQTDITTLRTGGNSTSIKCLPSTGIGPIETNYLKVFDYPIFADTSAKTYTVYVNLPAAGFTAAPTNTELWLSAEVLGATGPARREIVSTGVVTADGNWQAITITCTPGQAGNLYLKMFYCKTIEAGKTNVFYVDPKVVIS